MTRWNLLMGHCLIFPSYCLFSLFWVKSVLFLQSPSTVLLLPHCCIVDPEPLSLRSQNIPRKPLIIMAFLGNDAPLFRLNK